MDFNEAESSPAFVNGPSESQPKKTKSSLPDPWQDEFLGMAPKPSEDVFNRVDYRDYDFLRFAKDESGKPRKIVTLKYKDPLMASFDNAMVLGTTDDE